MAVFGLGQHHSGEEGAQSQRQSGELGDPPRREYDQQHRQREQLA